MALFDLTGKSESDNNRDFKKGFAAYCDSLTQDQRRSIMQITFDEINHPDFKY